MTSTTLTATRRTPLVPWPRSALVITAGAGAVFLVIGILAWHENRGFAIDDAFRRWVLRTFDVYTRYDMVQLTDRWAVVLAVAVIAALAALARRWDLAALAVGGPLVATCLTEYVFKPIFDRSVPLVAQLTGVEAKAYPSGHETAVSSVLVLLALILFRARLPRLVKVAGAMALAAYYVVTVFGLVGQYYHYLSDTVGALAVATAVVLGGALGIDRLLVRS